MMTIKEYQNLCAIFITTLFGKIMEDEHEITMLKDNEKNIQKTEKKFIAVNASSSKVTSLVHEGNESNKDSPSEEGMGLFVRRYNHYIQRNDIKNSDKNLINFRKASLK